MTRYVDFGIFYSTTGAIKGGFVRSVCLQIYNKNSLLQIFVKKIIGSHLVRQALPRFRPLLKDMPATLY